MIYRKIYLDLLLILNFGFDLILLLSVSMILKRNVSIFNLIKGALIGSLSLILLFFRMNSLTLFIYKFLISILMIIISFKYKNIKYTFKNLLYLYSASFILGGFLYYLNLEFSYKNYNLVFINKGLSINVIFLFIFSPIIIYIYIKQGLWLKNNYSNYYKMNLFYKNKTYNLNAFLDTGNTLSVPFSNKPIILIKCNIEPDNFFYVPYKCVKGCDLIKCFKADIQIEGMIKKNVVIGLLKEKIDIDGIDCLLNKKILEE